LLVLEGSGFRRFKNNKTYDPDPDPENWKKLTSKKTAA
jgi:hypothetical protein